jgi:DnaK suppressor protein
MSGEDSARRAALADSLHRLRASLLAQVRTQSDNAPERPFVSILDGLPGDSADLATSRLFAELDLSRNERLEQELREVDAALHRLAGGTYGLCVDCGEQIDPARLRAWPTAMRCLDCQDRFEKFCAAHATPHP